MRYKPDTGCTSTRLDILYSILIQNYNSNIIKNHRRFVVTNEMRLIRIRETMN